LGAKAIRSAYPLKNWKLDTVKSICRRFDKTGSTVQRKFGNGRPKLARSAHNIAKVQELISSQEDQLGTSKSTRQIAREVGICEGSVRQIAKKDLHLLSFKRRPVQVINEATSLKRLTRSEKLSRRLTVQDIKQVFFTDEKIFYLSPPINSQKNPV